jgi:hypothetical protein
MATAAARFMPLRGISILRPQNTQSQQPFNNMALKQYVMLP